MKRRTFIKTGLLGAFATGITPVSLLEGRDCDTTSADILGPYWAEDHPYRTVLANSEEPISNVVSRTTEARRAPLRTPLLSRLGWVYPPTHGIDAVFGTLGRATKFVPIGDAVEFEMPLRDDIMAPQQNSVECASRGD